MLYPVGPARQSPVLSDLRQPRGGGARLRHVRSPPQNAMESTDPFPGLLRPRHVREGDADFTEARDDDDLIQVNDVA